MTFVIAVWRGKEAESSPREYWQISIAILAATFTSIAVADDFKTTDGKEYKNAKVSRVEPDGIVITFSGGIVKLPFTELPEDVQKKYGYNSSAAAEYSAEEYEKQKALAQQRKADEQRRFEERQKYLSDRPAPQISQAQPQSVGRSSMRGSMLDERAAPQQPQQQSSPSSTLHGSALDRPAYGQSTGGISPDYLVSEYTRSEIKADELYKGRRFAMNGTIKSVFKSGGKAAIELLIRHHSGGRGTVIWMCCYFNDPREVAWKNVGDAIALTGTVAGMSGNTLTIEDCHL